MKRIGNLYEKVYAFDNLILAAKKAQKGKRKKNSTAHFFYQLEENVLELIAELKTESYQPGKYTTFYITDPKKRLISASPFKDRVIHHALCNIIEPIFEKKFIFGSYANRKGKGTHKAILKYQYYSRQYKYVLKCDIRKFFPSIDHSILKKIIRRKIKCAKTLTLIDTIIDNSNPQEEHNQWFEGDDLFSPFERKKGLPIGNLTSQFWANVYMDQLDHYVKEELAIKGYIRYVDDFVLFSDYKNELHEVKRKIIHFLKGLRLIIHPNKSEIYQVKDGVPFLGFTVYPNHKYVLKQKSHRHKRWIRKQLSLKRKGLLTAQQLEDSLNSWLGHLRFGSHKKVERKIFLYIRSQGVNLVTHPRGSWRVLDQ